MKTAIDYLVETLAENGIIHSSDISKAKEMEKQQIIDAYIEASPRLEDITKEAAENYYNERFKTNKG